MQQLAAAVKRQLPRQRSVAEGTCLNDVRATAIFEPRGRGFRILQIATVGWTCSQPLDVVHSSDWDTTSAVGRKVLWNILHEHQPLMIVTAFPCAVWSSWAATEMAQGRGDDYENTTGGRGGRHAHGSEKTCLNRRRYLPGRCLSAITSVLMNKSTTTLAWHKRSRQVGCRVSFKPMLSIFVFSSCKFTRRLLSFMFSSRLLLH